MNHEKYRKASHTRVLSFQTANIAVSIYMSARATFPFPFLSMLFLSLSLFFSLLLFLTFYVLYKLIRVRVQLFSIPTIIRGVKESRVAFSETLVQGMGTIDVIVVGSGIAGMTAAGLLARRYGIGIFYVRGNGWEDGLSKRGIH